MPSHISGRRTTVTSVRIALLLLAFGLPEGRDVRADWQMYGNDAGRTGYTSEQLSEQLSERWTHQSSHAPTPAWPRSDRMTFDRAYQVVVAERLVIYGSSADGIIRALDADTGDVRWTFATDGPVRFAPAVWRDRVIVSSDDGHLYALSRQDGKLLWKRRGGPDHSSVLGNQRMISKWPARGGPVVVDDVVYFAAGIWPSDGIFVYALNADTGEVLWCNDDSGRINMPQPHGGAEAASGVSAQGYLVAGTDRLFVPTGRAVPAAFDRKTGSFAYFHLQRYGQYGGSSTLATDDKFFNGGLAFRSDNGDLQVKLGGGQLAATPNELLRANGSAVEGYQWQDVDQTDRRGQTAKKRTLVRIWSTPVTGKVSSLIVADQNVVCGSDGQVDIIDLASKQVTTSLKVEGKVHGLAASAGQLLASTDRGRIYCFDGPAETMVARTPDISDQHEVAASDEQAVRAADEIIRRTGVTAGYCLDLGVGDGSLACELARRTELRILALTDDPAVAAAVRQKLQATGLYGARLTVHCRKLDSTGYPQYFADLIVSERSIEQAADSDLSPEIQRLLRPYGGVACTGRPGQMSVRKRGALKNAGSWSHQYANAANTLTSNDQLVGGRLSMLWFRDIDFDVPQRHGRAPAPLYHDGRIFHEGLNGIIAVDAYNGRELWRYEIPGLLTAYDGDELMGVSGTGSNFCIDQNSVYVCQDKRCLRLDAASGGLLREFQTPLLSSGEAGIWGYVACVDGILFGTISNPEHIVTYRYVKNTGDMSRQLTESQELFALDVTTGKLLWRYQAADSIRHNAIAVGDAKVFVIDRPLALFDREKKPESKEHSTGRLLALDTRTGEEIWSDASDIYGTLLAMSETHNVLLMSYQPTRFRLDSEIGGRMTALDASSGKRLWDVKAGFDSRPMINDDVIYAQGGAWNLLSGEPRQFNFRRSYGCGILAASRKLLVFRSATLGYFNFGSDAGVENYGGIRPGCWINVLPVGGLVLAPDATAGCRCSYLNRAWIALEPTQ